MKNPNLEKTQEVTLVRQPPPPVLRWDWNGDRVLLLYRDDALVVELRKKTEAGVSWHLHHPNGAVVLAGASRTIPAWRITKNSAQRAAEAFARGEAIAP